jgi:aspartate aminotransferase
MTEPLDLTPYLNGPTSSPSDLSAVGASIKGSDILRIAGEIRALCQSGKKILNLTVGDFSPKEFPVPKVLVSESIKALERGETNYPPSDGIPELKAAIVDLYKRDLGLSYPLSSIIVHSGGRPGLFAAFQALVNPGDGVIFGAPSWNNDLYCGLLRAKPIVLETSAEHGFFPTVEQIRPVVEHARILCLNSPSNPCGTVITEAHLRSLCDFVIEENEQRARRGAPGLYVLYDQLYWKLTFQGATHFTPVGIEPKMAAYTIFVDGISKWCAATGLRVGWVVVPPCLSGAVKDIVAQVGAWAPKPIQYGTAALLNYTTGLKTYLDDLRSKVQLRLTMLATMFSELKEKGHPVDCLAPKGAIYLSVYLGLIGKKTQQGVLKNNDDIRKYLLSEAHFAVVPFDAFSMERADGWFRISVGSVSVDDVKHGVEALPKLIEGLS